MDINGGDGYVRGGGRSWRLLVAEHGCVVWVNTALGAAHTESHSRGPVVPSVSLRTLTLSRLSKVMWLERG